MNARVRADLIVGRPVRDASGRRVGRLGEMRIELAAPGGTDYVVREFELITGGWLASLVGAQFAAVVARWLGREPARRVVGWRELDLTNPTAPRLRS
ncbi:MAG TPA: PRC-barrel domain-containing protein [Gemmatimonadaceae bacterium]|nr:PRC-barrel domain-containing protein [Gemmatimonadaceae bacterium]